MNDVPAPAQAEVLVDLGALRHNVRRLAEIVGADLPPDRRAPEVMVVVKADGYGHGMVPAARAARDAGASWLGVATAPEALALRASGDEGRLLCWLFAPGIDFAPLIERQVDVTASSVAQLEEICRAAAQAGRLARVQIKFDTGLSRNGAPRSEWLALVTAARNAELAGTVHVTGLWSHFACSDELEHPANERQEVAFAKACALADDAGLRPEVRHLANSAGAIWRPTARLDLVRLGIAAYGLSPAPQAADSAALGLVPAMTVRGTLAHAKDIATGDGVSYGHAFVAPGPMRVGLVPMGYGDGVPRHASGTAEVSVGGRRARVLGRICMDQFVVAAPDARAGEEVLLFGPGTSGEPSAQDWADWCGTISYEIVTRMGGRQVRTYVGENGSS